MDKNLLRYENHWVRDLNPSPSLVRSEVNQPRSMEEHVNIPKTLRNDPGNCSSRLSTTFAVVLGTNQRSQELRVESVLAKMIVSRRRPIVTVKFLCKTIG